MIWFFLAALIVVLAAVSMRFLLAAITESPIYCGLNGHSAMALRVGRAYRIFSWSVVTLVLIGTLVQLFWQAAQAWLV